MDDTSLLEPISPDAPCGPDLEYDSEFLALEASIDAAYVERATGPEGEVSPPDWRDIERAALTLLGRSRDLRVLAVLTKARLHTRGIAGFARGLELIERLLSLRWGSLHPQVGAQGDADGLMRVNALRSLCDARSAIAPLRGAILVRARGLGELCLRDLEQARAAQSGQSAQSATAGQSATTGQSATAVNDMSRVDACFMGCVLEELQASCDAVRNARAAVSRLEQLCTEHALPAALRLSELSGQLDTMMGLLEPRMRARLTAASAVEAEPEPSGTTPANDRPNTVQAVSAAPHALSDAPSTRAEVVRGIDWLCAYYELHEPSSPVPLLLRRAQRLAGLPFLELVRELAPSGLAEIEALRGPQGPATSQS